MSAAEQDSRDGADSRAAGTAGPFAGLPAESVVRAFGVDYAHVRPPEGGDLYVTRYGWPHLSALMPARWYTGQRFASEGTRLRGSSGHVYRLRTRRDDGRALDLVLKFSRVAQDVPVVVGDACPEELTPELLAEIRFNSPMEEFGLLEELRERALGADGNRILTQQPLAIYAPPEACEEWQLGRSSSSFRAHTQMLAEDQEHSPRAIELDIRRIYVLLYRWIAGHDAQDWFEAGSLEEAEFRALAPRVTRELSERGFRVHDNKPRHFILRARPAEGGPLLRRAGRLAYGLVDFELLERTPEHQARWRAARQHQYWSLQAPRAAGTPGPPAASSLQPVSILGVDYLFGTTPEGGKLWVVGREPALFDYFLPDRWRRTRRLKLSDVDDVFVTRTRDDVEVVYRRSRTGLRPRADPLTLKGQRIRESGYNCPFEEIAIAERLRRMGIDTTRPRAIHRTGHESIKARALRDRRREAAFAALRTPEDPPAPILDADHDYYSIWDLHRDPGPAADGTARHVIGLGRAEGLPGFGRHDAQAALRDARARLTRVGLPADSLDDDELGLVLDAAGRPVFAGGAPEIRLTIDALSAYDHGLLAQQDYVELIRRVETKLRAVDCEKLDPNGRHLLLSMDPDGRMRRDADGELHAVLCNFVLIRGLYRAFV